jgi:protein SCO1/2
MPVRLLALIAILLAGALGAVGCGDAGDRAAGGATTTVASTTTGDHGDGHGGEEPAPISASEVLFPPAPAPELGLRDHLGRRVTTAEFRGKVMLVTFVYAHCPDVCPLIVSNLRRTLDRLGPRAKNVQVIAVSVDPKGDTRRVVTTYLRNQKMTGRMLWLVGSRSELERVWTRWGVATRIPRDSPELVEHVAPIYGVDAKGTIATLYDVQFTPKDVLRDIPGLLGA